MSRQFDPYLAGLPAFLSATDLHITEAERAALIDLMPRLAASEVLNFDMGDPYQCIIGQIREGRFLPFSYALNCFFSLCEQFVRETGMLPAFSIYDAPQPIWAKAIHNFLSTGSPRLADLFPNEPRKRPL